eukprot:scaffold40190_cov63-Phaeocystis_antarctica.AAC.1
MLRSPAPTSAACSGAAQRPSPRDHRAAETGAPGRGAGAMLGSCCPSPLRTGWPRRAAILPSSCPLAARCVPA